MHKKCEKISNLIVAFFINQDGNTLTYLCEHLCRKYFSNIQLPRNPLIFTTPLIRRKTWPPDGVDSFPYVPM